MALLGTPFEDCVERDGVWSDDRLALRLIESHLPEDIDGSLQLPAAYEFVKDHIEYGLIYVGAFQKY